MNETREGCIVVHNVNMTHFGVTYNKATVFVCRKCMDFMMPRSPSSPSFLPLQGYRFDKRQGLRWGIAKMGCRWHILVIERGYDWNTIVIVRMGWPMEEPNVEVVGSC